MADFIVKDYKGDLKARWYIDYYIVNPITLKRERQREWISSKLTTKKARYDVIKTFIARQTRQSILRESEIQAQMQYADLMDTPVVNAIDFAYSLKELEIEHKTKYTYKSQVNVFKQWLELKRLSDLAIVEFNEVMALEFLDHVQIKRKIGPKTWNDYKWLMHGLFKLLLKRKYVRANPWDGIDSKKVPKKKKQILNDQLYQKYIEGLKEHSFGMYVMAQLIRFTLSRPPVAPPPELLPEPEPDPLF